MSDTNKTSAPKAYARKPYDSLDKTPLRPQQYGKKRSREANKKAKVIIQLFKASERVHRMYATLAQNGTISFFDSQLAYISNSFTNSKSSENRPVFFSHALDPNEYTTKDGRTVFGDSNVQVMRNFNAPNSGYNSLIVTANIGTGYIPYSTMEKPNSETAHLNWDSTKHNEHVKTLAKQLIVIDRSNTTEGEKRTALTRAWTEYQNVEKRLIEEGLLIQNNVLIAEDTSIVPALTASQYTTNPNQYYNGPSLYGNERSRATYAPITNFITGVFSITDALSDPKSEWEYGLTKSNNTNPNAREIKRCSAELVGYDFLNNPTAEPLRMIISDLMVSRNNSRAETFYDFTKSNPMVRIIEGALHLGFSTGGYSSIFSIEGSNVAYTSYQASTNGTANGLEDGMAVNLDEEVEIQYDDDSLDFVSDVGSEFTELFSENSSVGDLLDNYDYSNASSGSNNSSHTTMSPMDGEDDYSTSDRNLQAPLDTDFIQQVPVNNDSQTSNEALPSATEEDADF